MISDFTSTSSFLPAGSFVLILLLIFSLICCFNGYKLFKVLIKFYGFIILMFLGIVIGSLLGFSGGTLTIIAVCSGILGVFLSFKFYKAMVMFTIGYQCLIVLLSIIPSTAICVIISIVIGFLSTKFIKPVVSVTTAISSAVIIGDIISILLPFTIPFTIIIKIGFAIAGMVKQIT